MNAAGDGREEPRESERDTDSLGTGSLGTGSVVERLREAMQGVFESQEGAEEALPEFIGKHRVHRLLGSGAFGRVYLAEDPHLRRLDAIKVPGRKLLASRSRVDDLLHEAQTAANLRHPGLVAVHQVAQHEGRFYIVQQYIDGPTLDVWHHQRRRQLEAGHSPVSGSTPAATGSGAALVDDSHFDRERRWQRDVVGLVIEIADAVGYAHQQGFFHRDLKPRNILIDADGHPHVTDFGLAVHESIQNKLQGDVAGTPPYMSPEQVRGETHRLDGRTDIWGLGVILYELLTGRQPFQGVDRLAVFDEILTRDPRPLRQINSAIPAELARITHRCLAKRVSDRYSSAAELLEDLRAWQRMQSSPGTGDSATQSDKHSDKHSDVQRAPPPTAPVPARPPASDISSFVRVVPKGLQAFDEQDADFFLRLVPGPRDRDGLPASLRMWKKQIEQPDADRTFAVGLLFGPSGSGKSSLLRAGLLPRLSSRIATLVVEATGGETERRIRKQLAPFVPSSLADGELPDLFRLIREVGLRDGRKLLIVVDQFEQWLHVNHRLIDTPLVAALRHCDGAHVQCIVTVRDDFGMAATRFMDALDVPLVQGHNFATVDLFDVEHAEKVLLLFGQAFERLPEDRQQMTAQQRQFVSDVARGLAQDGRIVPVRLALFAELIKSQPWVPATLEAVGGTHGIGVNFLEETFSSRKANPKHRQHAPAARRVFAALLPQLDLNIKGHMRSSDELLKAAGYGDRPQAFDELMRILDGELRLITPTDPEGIGGESDETEPLERARYYQLTHDYLVPALREWLTRGQRQSRRGRAELCLAERASLWVAKPEDRHLPTTLELIRIGVLVPRRERSEVQRRMLRRATVVSGRRWGAVLLVLLLAGWGLNEARRQNVRVAVASLAGASGANVPESLRMLREYPRELVRRELWRAYERTEIGDAAQRSIAYGLAEHDEVPVERLIEAVGSAGAEEIDNLATALGRHPDASSHLREAADRATGRADWPMKARLAIIALHTGNTTIAADMLAERADPEQRSVLLDLLPTWPGDLGRLAEVAAAVSDETVRSGLCLAVGAVPARRFDDAPRKAWRSIVERWYAESPNGGTHSAAGWALRTWGAGPATPSPDDVVETGRQWRHTPSGLTMVLVSAGSFQRGPPNDGPPSTAPQLVQISRSFWMSDCEVRRGLYTEFLGDDAYPGERPTRTMIPPFPGGTDDHPVCFVGWYDAVKFCNWLSWREGLAACYINTHERELDDQGEEIGDLWRFDAEANGYRLPTEAEWEYACRAGTTTAYSFGQTPRLLDSYAVSSQNTQPVGSKLCNSWGLFDMHGNLAELCHDIYEPGYDPQPTRDPTGPAAGHRRVVRGGSYNSPAPMMLESGFRHYSGPHFAVEFTIRVVRGAE